MEKTKEKSIVAKILPWFFVIMFVFFMIMFFKSI
jgi:hypothetical protein